ncbi:sensor histidine kinase [Roseibacillus ishigakijimensis]|uniref:histidine kinase n=1 Tax=Roseibacillus ishigakijimensis TaxID=454146 RepID=A0A934RP91_9BACT|nr:HAMP domain-containing sensor histidine kinase [Roseibacillus ishigakijimensis]MBK1834460.1 HAMP domain-containing histidine kinase [Roseibacillus ishigakijimensis]
MRLAALTLLPMALVALLVLLGGERLARRSDETRQALDRDRLLDFSQSLRRELTRLDELYEGHLARLAAASTELNEREFRPLLAEVTAIEACRVFRQTGPELEVFVPSQRANLPEITLAERRRPLNPEKAVVLPQDYLDEPLPAAGHWLRAPDGRHLVHCRPVQSGQAGHFVAFLIDEQALRARVNDHLAEWLPAIARPLSEGGEQVALLSPTGQTLARYGPDQKGIAAALIPERTHFGIYELRGWDRVTSVTRHDPATLAASIALSALLLAAGGALFLQQRRSLRLAAQRVSFVNRVSHELGSPLTNLTLNLDLAREALARDPAQTRRRLQLVTEETERLARLVGNVLSFSRRERDCLTVQAEVCQPTVLTRQVLETFRPALERRGMSLESDVAELPPHKLDPDAFCQILANLLSNCEKYAASGQWVRVSLREEKDALVLEVADRGPGIPSRARERIFRPFERVHDDTAEGSSGTGLGLTIARDLARRMEGDLVFCPARAPSGCLFRLTLPLRPVLSLLPSQEKSA